MSNYLKIPLPQHTDAVIPLLNNLLESHPEWDKITTVVGIQLKETSMNFTFMQTDGGTPSADQKAQTFKVFSELGIQYEYNI